MPSAGRKGNYSVPDSGVRRDPRPSETKSDRGAVAALGRQGAQLEGAGCSAGRRRQGAPRGYPAGLMIDRPAPETKSDRGAVAAHGRQGALYLSRQSPAHK